MAAGAALFVATSMLVGAGAFMTADEAPVASPPAPFEVRLPPPPEAPRPRPRAPTVENVDVAEVETLARPKYLPLLREDRSFEIHRALKPASDGCSAPMEVKVRTAALRVEGPGGLEDPRSRLALQLWVRRGATTEPACREVAFHLASMDGQAVSKQARVVSDAPGVERVVSTNFEFPRTLEKVRLCGGGDRSIVLNLETGKGRDALTRGRQEEPVPPLPPGERAQRRAF